ncbi:MAG: putative EndoIII-related endonuclease [Atribacteria bacterium 34_868]|jgi:endonuclease-3|nr:MAG: putative EndoIII-related endonuclease [Atribacteria bacterium 34_868]
MILPYARNINFDELMKKLFDELQFYKHLPLINQMNKNEKDPYQILISAMLSSRTKDEITAKASERLFARAPNPEKLSRMTEEEIIYLIYPVGFYRIKAKNIKKIANILLEKYGGMVPDNLNDLIQLPGVGRKTANLVLGIAFHRNTITVDTHVHRISNRLGIVKTSNPKETELDLMMILPQKYWICFNTYLVAHGQKICNPIIPKCSQCKIMPYCRQIGVIRHR